MCSAGYESIDAHSIVHTQLYTATSVVHIKELIMPSALHYINPGRGKSSDYNNLREHYDAIIEEWNEKLSNMRGKRIIGLELNHNNHRDVTMYSLKLSFTDNDSASKISIRNFNTRNTLFLPICIYSNPSRGGWFMKLELSKNIYISDISKLPDYMWITGSGEYRVPTGTDNSRFLITPSTYDLLSIVLPNMLLNGLSNFGDIFDQIFACGFYFVKIIKHVDCGNGNLWVLAFQQVE